MIHTEHAPTAPVEPAIGVDSTVNDVLLRYPQTAGVFSARGVDFCCGGALSLATGASKHKIDIGELILDLEIAALARLDGFESV